MQQLQTASSTDQTTALSLSTVAFTACFAVWTIFSIIGIQIKQELGLSETQFGLLVGIPILTGSLSRIFLGIWADQYGGRLVFTAVMVAAAIATFLLTWADTYLTTLVAALGVGLAGGSFAVGIAYVSRWYPTERQGTALGIFGVGNVGAAVTKFAAPFVLVAYGWQTVANVWAIGLLVMAAVFWFSTKDDPVLVERRRRGEKPRGTLMELTPLKKLQVWRFALYYFFVFGGFVALALWLPHYLIGVYGVDIRTAGMIAAFYSVPASVFRAYGGVLSDRYGARSIMYWTFGISAVCLFMLSYPPTEYVIRGIDGPIQFSTEIGIAPFLLLIFVLGFFMSLGKAAVYKHIPVYYPGHVGAVGGLVGMIGGLGGFVLPITFGVMNDVVGIWTSCFALLFAIVAVSFLWMHVAIRRMERQAMARELGQLPQLPEFQEIHEPEKHKGLGPVIADWRPEEPQFWAETGRPIARRNLYVSVFCLLLAFAVWMVWSMVVAKLPAVGFDFTTQQLFWLAALPALSGATLRIFYSFMVPIFGGRVWTTLTTASLLIPAFGIGYAVQNPETPYFIFLVLALLCGFGGGNFASSMSNISFFFPKREKGNALALNAGIGNLGVSLMQFLVPIVITLGIFGALGGAPQEVGEGQRLWLQNAGFVWVPFIIVATALAWFGMNDIAAMRASFAEQTVIFTRKHNWLMCWLYVGTFGSFIGYSAGFPLLMRSQFPAIDALQLAFLGPLLGALARALTGWISDKYGGGRVTLWVFAGMAVAVLGVIFFLGIKEQPIAFYGFFLMFLLLFTLTGIGNASTFQMIPVIMREDMARLMPEADIQTRTRQAEKEAAAIIGFTSAIGAYGGFFIPQSYGISIAVTGGATAALWAFFVFYLTCIALTWLYYTRRGAILHAIEHGKAGEPAATAPAVR